MQRYNVANVPRREYDARYPVNLIDVPSASLDSKHMKPAALVNYLIQTYTNPGDVVLDPAMHRGIVGQQCHALQRRFVGIERHEPFFIEALSLLQVATEANDQPDPE